MTIHAALRAPRLRRIASFTVRGWSWLAWLVLLAALPAAATPLEIEGEWYVLVHFEERAGGSPEAEAIVDYRDFVWRFERRGEALRWTIFRSPGFRDDTGRTETIRGTPARLRHAWWPDRSQLDEVREGLSVDDGSARTKTLRRRAPGRWSSGGAPRPSSASALSYGERWEVRFEPDDEEGGEHGAGVKGGERDVLPVFELTATLASGRSDSLEGRTLFEADRVEPEAGRIEGRFQRDESETGRFTMWKKGVRAPDDAAFALRAGQHPLLGPGGSARSDVIELEARIARAGTPEGREDAALRQRIRSDLRRLVEESYTRRGLALRPHRAEIDARVDEIERLCVVEQVSLLEVERRLGEGPSEEGSPEEGRPGEGRSREGSPQR